MALEYIYDIKTTNLSFLFVSQQLRNEGVKNNKFMLKLYNQDLVGVDPFSPNLTERQKIDIYDEICINKWYYLREVIRIPQTGAPNGVQYKLNKGNLAQSYAVSNNLNIVSLLPRQQGKTIGMVCDHSWIMFFASSGCQMIYMNKAYPDAIENGRRLKGIRENLPKFIQEMISHKDDKDNINEKFIASNKNQLLIKSSATSEASADKLGRGLTCALIYADEFAFINKVDIIYDACNPAWRTAAESAKATGVPYGMHFTTTPNNIDTESGKWVYKFISQCTKFSYSFYDMNEREIKRMLKDRGGKPFVHIEYKWQEIGRSQTWYDEMCSQMDSALKKQRELDLVWTNSTDNSIFETEEIDEIFANVKKPMYNLTVPVIMDKKFGSRTYNNVIEFYEKVDLNRRFILSCDVGGGVLQDRSVINIIDPSSFRVVGDIAQAKIDTEVFKLLIETLMTKYMPNSLLVVERNSFGTNILDYMTKIDYLEPRIYRSKQEKEASVTKKRTKRIEKETSEYKYGVYTSAKSREAMFSLLPMIVREEPDVFTSETLAREISTLAEIKGKVQAMPGTHDDSVMAYLIFRYAVGTGDFFMNYGITNTRSLKTIEETFSLGQKAIKMTNIIDRTETRYGGTRYTNGQFVSQHNINPNLKTFDTEDYIRRASERIASGTSGPDDRARELGALMDKWNSSIF